MKQLKKAMSMIISLLMVLSMALGLAPVNVFAEGGTGLVVAGGTEGPDYTYSEGVLTILSSREFTIKNKTTAYTSDRIVVAAGVSANITLAGVNIDTSSTGEAAFKIEDNSTGNVTVTLEKDKSNILKSYWGAGLEENGAGDGIGTLTITGEGTLNAESKMGAGIGAGSDGSASDIRIYGGSVKASKITEQTYDADGKQKHIYLKFRILAAIT